MCFSSFGYTFHVYLLKKCPDFKVKTEERPEKSTNKPCWLLMLALQSLQCSVSLEAGLATDGLQKMICGIM